MTTATLPRGLLLMIAFHLLPVSLDAATRADQALPDAVADISEKLETHAFDDALAMIEDLEQANDPKAHLIRAVQYEMGIGVSIDQEKALIHAHNAAKAEDWEAAQYLAWRAAIATGSARDSIRITHWREKMELWKASNPTPRAIPETLLRPTLDGSYEPLYAEVTLWNHERARAGDPAAQFNMFMYHINGQIAGTESTVAALHWLMRAARGGNGPAARWLSIFYESGFLIEQDSSSAMRFLVRAAEAGDAQAQFDYAMRWIGGRGLEKDIPAGLNWLEKSAEQHHLPAITALAGILEDGEITERDHPRAQTLYSQAVALGNTDSIHRLAWLLLYGDGVDRDPERAISLFEQSASRGNFSSAYQLARAHLDGKVVPANPSLAWTWAQKAIDHGSDYARYVHGMILRDGLLGEVDYESAFENFEIAAREGHSESQIQVGYLLLWGMGIDRDLEESYSWYKLAATNGSHYAARWMLLMEGLGWGTTQNPDSLVEYLAGISDQPRSESSENELRKLLMASRAPDPDRKSAADPDLEASWSEALQQQIRTALDRGANLPPRPFHSPPPTYPPILHLLALEDKVVVVLTIAADGSVEHIDYAQQPLPQFREAIEQAMPHWRFLPAISEGKPIAARVRMTIPFSIIKDPLPPSDAHE